MSSHCPPLNEMGNELPNRSFHGRVVAQNPFATRCTRPGTIPYFFGSGENLATLLDRLDELGGTAQIVGPHGSGKTTLLAMLVSHWKSLDRKIDQHQIRKTDNSTAMLFAGSASWNAETQIVIDSFDLLSRCQRTRLLWFAKRRRCGILVASHRELARVPVLYRTRGSLQATFRIVQRLLPPKCELIQTSDVAGCFERCNRNVRETLFGLYDMYEQRRR